MTDHHNLPRLPLVDLTSRYLVHLDGIDAENQFRHRQGDPLMAYPSFEEFVDLCREKAFDLEVKVCAHVHEFESFNRVLEAEYCDDPELKWLLPLHAFGIASEDEETADQGMPDGTMWVTSHGSFPIVSSSKH